MGNGEAGYYVGETSRPVRERVYEHMCALRKWKTTSFQIDHWMLRHPTETSPPCFKFEILACYKDALRRQIREGLSIMDTGTLNKRMEFNSNELCRLVTMDSKLVTDADLKQELLARSKHNENLQNFITVMKRVSECDSDNVIVNNNKSDVKQAKIDVLFCRQDLTKKRGWKHQHHFLTGGIPL